MLNNVSKLANITLNIKMSPILTRGKVVVVIVWQLDDLQLPEQ